MKIIMFLLVSVQLSFIGSIIKHVEGAEKISITIVYDNYILKEGTRSDWGFACFIEGTEKTILFDTGSQGQILLMNMDSLRIDLDSLDLIVISHNHSDHTGGLNSVLGRKSEIPVYFGFSFPASFSQNISNKGATPIRVDDPIQICEHVFSTGELQGPVYEQSLILDTEDGLVIVTGCSHPGIINILKKAQEVLNRNIYLVFGGFHLLNHSDAMVNQIIQEFKALGVEKCGATHCTGDRPITLFKEAYGENFVAMGVGKVIQVSISTTEVKESDNGELNIPNGIKLNQNYPNPFNPITTIGFDLTKTCNVTLKIFNIIGEEVAILVSDRLNAGTYSYDWSPPVGMASGVYLYRLETGEFTETKKMILMR